MPRLQLELADNGEMFRGETTLSNAKIVNKGPLYLCVPDPNNKKKPLYVREDLFDGLPDTEFDKLINYSAGFNPPEKLKQIIIRRLNRTDGTGNVSALAAVQCIFQNFAKVIQNKEMADGELDVVGFDPNPVVGKPKPDTTSFWDQAPILNIKNKYLVGGLAAYLLLIK